MSTHRRPSWKQGMVTILDRTSSTKTVRADIWGPFAVHRDTGDYCVAAWAVTHVPTGRRIASAWFKARAQAFCAEVEPLLDWQAIQDGPCPPEAAEAIWQAKRRARETQRRLYRVPAVGRPS